MSKEFIKYKKLFLCNYRNCDSWGFCPHSEPHEELEDCFSYNCNSQGQCAECLPYEKEIEKEGK